MSDLPGHDAGAEGPGTAGEQHDAPPTTHYPTVPAPQPRIPQGPQSHRANDKPPRHHAEHSSHAAGSSIEGLHFPFHVFLYGPLMDPDVLQAVIGVARRPRLRPASIRGWQLLMYGSYPALVTQTTQGDTGQDKVAGLAWECRSSKQLARLQDYETEAYVLRPCDIFLEGAEETLRDSRVFCWAGHPESGELAEGTFDLEWYQEHLKPAFVCD